LLEYYSRNNKFDEFKKLIDEHKLDLSETNILQTITNAEHLEYIIKNIKVKFNYKALVDVIENDRYDCMKVLLRNGCDPNLINDEKSVIHYAIHIDIKYVELLIKYNVIIDKSITIYAIIQNLNLEIIKLLLEHSKLDLIESTPLLIYAINKLRYNLVKLLLELGTDVNVVDISGNTPIYYACLLRDTEIVKLLLQYNLDISRLMLNCIRKNTSPEIFKLVERYYKIKNKSDEYDKINDNKSETEMEVRCILM
jgi:ankyrin repeat protein